MSPQIRDQRPEIWMTELKTEPCRYLGKNIPENGKKKQRGSEVEGI